MKETKNYDDIIGLERPVSPTRQRMSMHDRAAQFAPFAALTGYDGMVEETARLTDTKDGENEESTILLDRKLRLLNDRADEHPYIEITHFIPDERKSGGRYETIYGYLKRIDGNERCIILQDKQVIRFDRIRYLDSTIFNDMV